MALLELSLITGTLAQMGLEKGFQALGRTEAAIRVRHKLKLPAEPDPADFGSLYRHALVEWGVFKPQPVLDFFRDKRIYDAFRRAHQTGDPTILDREAAEVVRWAEEFGVFGGLEYDPRREIAAFAAVFDLLVAYTRPAADAKRDQAIAEQGRKLDEALALLARPDLRIAGTPAGSAAPDDVHFSGQFQNVIINLLSELKDTRQVVGAAGGAAAPPPTPLPPLDEAGRPPLPAPAPAPPPGSRLTLFPNPFFTGREAELRQLARDLLYGPEDLSGGGVAATPPPDRSTKLVVIATGIGGVGKTQLAVEFAWRYGRYFAGGVQWVGLETEAAARDAVLDCGAALGLYGPAGGDLTAEEKIALVRHAWRAATPRLIVFDNCEEPALLAAWRPEPGGARVLVTSRNDDWPAGVVTRPLETLPRAQSVALLREYVEASRGAGEAGAGQESGSGGERPLTTGPLFDLAAALGDLPLALTLAGSYLSAYPDIPITGYLKQLEQPDLLAHIIPRPEAAHSWTAHDLNVARTFAVSYDRLRPDEDATDAAARLLLAGATYLVHGEPFPRALLTLMLEEVDGLPDDPHRPDDALRRLLALGLLERAGAGRLRLHRLLAAFAAGAIGRLDETTGAGVMDAARAAVEGVVEAALRRANDSGDPRSLRGVELHLRHVVDGTAGREDEPAALLCNELGYYLNMSGDLAGARGYLERALAVTERVLGPEHPDVATATNNLGSLLQDQGDLAGARGYYKRALAVRERVLGPEHPHVATSLNNLGSLLQDQGDLAGARGYLERALAVLERVLGPEHPWTASSLGNLGSLLQAQGDLAGARGYYERALAVKERVLGPEHPSTATSLNNLGLLLQAQGDLAGARGYHERALAVYERVLGPEHPDTAGSLNNLGSLLDALDDDEAALAHYRRALDIRERVLGATHPATATSLHNTGALLVELGRPAEGRPLLERALAICLERLGPDHPLTQSTQRWLRGLE